MKSLAVILCVSSLLSGLSVRQQTEARQAAGWIEKMEGTASLRTAPDAKPVTLDAKRDLARRLYVGDSIRCPKGRLVIRIGDTVTAFEGLTEWFTIPARPSQERLAIRAALAAYGRIGGEERGTGRLFAPAAQSRVVPDQFVIRWQSGPRPGNVTFMIQPQDGGRVLWQEQGVDGSSGRLDSAASRDALSRYRSEGHTDLLLLRMIRNDRTEERLSFSLLSKEVEESLKAELAEWDAGHFDGFARHLGRAAVFAGLSVLTQAADEYEAALAMAPESRDLLARTIAAHQQTGNQQRVEDLKKRQR